MDIDVEDVRWIGEEEGGISVYTGRLEDGRPVIIKVIQRIAEE